jgi:catechol 2,3-dioxygenase-like lactoylglutathione lyase family enzyme
MEIVLDHCVIAVSDRARADRFYHDVLGAETRASAAASSTASAHSS